MVSHWAEMKKSKAVTPKSANGARVGINSGYKTTKRVRPIRTHQRQALQKTKLNAVREVVQEVVGLTPYERRCCELLKVQREKRALRFCKRRLGSFARGKKKREVLSNLMRKQAAKKGTKP